MPKLLPIPKLLRWFVATLLLAILAPIVSLHAQPVAWNVPDVDGSQDHPLIKRFVGSWLVGYQQVGFDAASFPTKIGLVDMNEFDNPVRVEGRITRLLYLAPPGKRPLEVHRNYINALKAAGFKPSVSCVPDTCEALSYGLRSQEKDMKIVDFASAVSQNSALEQILYRVDSGGNIFGNNNDLYMDVGTLTANDHTLHVMIYTDKHYTTDADISLTFIQIAEPEDMQTGQVSVNLDALQTTDKIAASIKADGKIALYGVYFDTGKAEVKPESTPQLAEMAKYLTANPDKQVFVVGHTDNTGSFAANQKLSMDRAQAVAKMLMSTYKIAAERVAAQGVANLSPVANNASDDGRAKNRRVELVER
jgi:OmpA-OmpF porin, OOP family